MLDHRSSGGAFDASVPNAARVYDALAGGHASYAADREAAAALEAVNPDVRDGIRDNREFLGRAVEWAAGRGIRQFLDLGAGFPPPVVSAETAGDDIAVVYVDADPVVASHLHALLAGPGVAVLKTDLRDLGAVAGAAGCAGIDLGEPVCVVFGAVLHLLDGDAARQAAAAYTGLLAPGSAVVISIWSADEVLAEKIAGAYPAPLYRHTREDITQWLAGLEVVPPGIVTARGWRPGWTTACTGTSPAHVLAGVGFKG